MGLDGWVDGEIQGWLKEKMDRWECMYGWQRGWVDEG